MTAALKHWLCADFSRVPRQGRIPGLVKLILAEILDMKVFIHLVAFMNIENMT